jgi:hypothetical protein
MAEKHTETEEEAEARMAAEANVEALEGELAMLEARGSRGESERRVAEVKAALDSAKGSKRTAPKGETRLRGAAAEKRGAE